MVSMFSLLVLAASVAVAAAENEPYILFAPNSHYSELPSSKDGVFAACLDVFPKGLVPNGPYLNQETSVAPRCIKFDSGASNGPISLYASHFNSRRHIPDFVAYILDDDYLSELSRKSGNFNWVSLKTIDDPVWAPGYEPMSRGHLRAFAHSNRNKISAAATFTFTNIFPSYSDFDGSVWSSWEASLRQYVEGEPRPLYVVLGPSIENSGQLSKKFIGQKREPLEHIIADNGEKVDVPKHIWSVIYDSNAEGKGRALGIWCLNAANWKKKINRGPIDEASYRCDDPSHSRIQHSPPRDEVPDDYVESDTFELWHDGEEDYILSLAKSSFRGLKGNDSPLSPRGCKVAYIKENIKYIEENPVRCEYKSVDEIAQLIKFDPLPGVTDKAIRSQKEPWAAFSKYAASKEHMFLRSKMDDEKDDYDREKHVTATWL